MTSTSTASNGWKPGRHELAPAGAQHEARRRVAVGAVARGGAAERDREARRASAPRRGRAGRPSSTAGVLESASARSASRPSTLSATSRSASSSSITRSVVNQREAQRAQHGLGLRHALELGGLDEAAGAAGAERPRARARRHRHAAPAEAPPRERRALGACSRARRSPRTTPRGRSSRCARSAGRRSAPRARAARARSCRPTGRRHRCSARPRRGRAERWQRGCARGRECGGRDIPVALQAPGAVVSVAAAARRRRRRSCASGSRQSFCSVGVGGDQPSARLAGPTSMRSRPPQMPGNVIGQVRRLTSASGNACGAPDPARS